MHVANSCSAVTHCRGSLLTSVVGQVHHTNPWPAATGLVQLALSLSNALLQASAFLSRAVGRSICLSDRLLRALPATMPYLPP